VGGQLHSKSALQGYLGKCRKARTPYPELRERMMAEFGFKTLSEKDEKALQDAYAAFLDAAATDTRAAEIKKMYGGKNPVLLVCSRIVDAKAGVKWGAFDHSDSKVVTSAIGVGSESFAGEGDNTMIPRKIEKAMGL
jgi:alkaline phosphatase